MTDFKWRHFQGDVILWAVRWYCRYPISYRDLEEMLAERGISVDHTTIYRWVQCYAPEMEKRLRWFWRRGFDPSWRLDETYVKVRGKWTYLYRAVDKRGDTIDFYLSPTRSAKAAKRLSSVDPAVGTAPPSPPAPGSASPYTYPEIAGMWISSFAFATVKVTVFVPVRNALALSA